MLQPTTTHRAVAQRDSEGWRVRIEGVGGAAGVQARDLADVEPRVRKLLWSTTGCNPADIQLDVEVRLPPAIEFTMSLAQQLCEDGSTEAEVAVRDLLAARMSMRDVSWILRTRCRMPRPLTMTNAEIAKDGMAQHPDALGLHWDDHGHFLTRTCRECVDATRKSYVGFPPDDENLIIYQGPLRCDWCGEDFPDPEAPSR